MNTNEGQALFARIQENLADLAPQLIFSDWLEEQERLNEALLWRGTKPTKLNLYELYGYGNGDGYGDGYGGGSGFGHGYGNGYGYGYGYGYGNGNGFGNGHGYGYGSDDGYSYIQRRDVWLKENKEILKNIISL